MPRAHLPKVAMTDNPILPVHPDTGLTAIGLLKDGRPVWPVMGGDGTGETDPADPPADPADPPADPEPDDKLDEPGKKALVAEREARKAAVAARKAAEHKAAELQKVVDAAEDAKKSDLEKAQAALAAAEKRASDAASRAVRAEVKAAAVGWADPADAPRYLDDLTAYVDADGQIDAERIAADLAAVLEAKPHLKATPSTAPEPKKAAPKPDPSQGNRGSGPPRSKSLSEAVANALKK